MARRSRRMATPGPGTQEFTPWNPAAGQNNMSMAEYAARHPGVRNQAMLRDKYAGAMSASGTQAFNQRHEGDVVGDIAEGRIKIMPEAVPGAAPSTPLNPVDPGFWGGPSRPNAPSMDPGMNDRFTEILRGYGPDRPGTGGSGDDQRKAPTPQGAANGMLGPDMTYKQYLNGRGSTAMLAGLFRELQGGPITSKMRAAMQAGAQATSAKNQKFARQEAKALRTAKRRRQPIIEE